ncbi:MAG: hypothetical protein C6Y20_16405 [Tagaea sp. CACIAM 22H2]|nr:hypothetical protein [Tagaea sp. CACIAM 22H2]
MRIEAFSEAKRADAPDTNEDAFLILPGRAYAVMDGVSDRIGSRYDGVLAGRYASQLLRRTLEAWLTGPEAKLDDPWAAVEIATAAIRGTYDRLGLTDAVRGDWNRQMASTLTLVTFAGDTAHAVLVGDSGLRINGKTVWREDKDIDTISSMLRRFAWPVIASRVVDPDERERLSRKVSWGGTRHADVEGVMTPSEMAEVEAKTLDFCRVELSHVPRAEAEKMVFGGIVHGQGGFQNNDDAVLGYASLNGFDIRRDKIRIESLPAAEIETLELYSDGYFEPGDAFGIDSWEAKFRDIERRDPHKITEILAPRGSLAGLWTDDRTYLGIVR